MKKLYCIVALLLSNVATAWCQWSIDSADPLVVCNAAGAQSKMRAFDDGNGGYYVLWVDERVANMPHIYGQRYDSLGVAQWTANGKALTDTTEKSNEFAAVRVANGNIVLAYKRNLVTGGGDTLECLLLDANGEALSTPAVLGGSNPGTLYVNNMEMLEKDNGAYIACMLTYMGGSTGYFVTRVDATGASMFGYNGIAVPTSGYGPFAIAPDGTGKLFFYWRLGNGAGAGLNVQRIDEACNAMWSTATDPTAGTPGLGYDFRGVYDNHHGLILTWVKNGGDILMSRVDTSGALTWTPNAMTVCDESHNQDLPRIAMHGNWFYVLWQDNRPPAANADVYMQRFDLNGQPQWNPLGVRASNVNTYIPYSQLVPSNDGSVIYTIEGSGTEAFSANKMLPDTTLAWTPSGVQIATNAFNPFYDEYKLLTAIDSGAVVFWNSNGDLYGARVRYTGELFNAIETVNATNVVTTYPNPTSDVVAIKLQHNEPIQRACVYGIDGKIIKTVATVNGTIDVHELNTGMYLLQLETTNGSLRAKFIKE